MKNLMLAVAAISLLGGAAPALAAPCKDAHGKFIKCPTVKVAAKPKVCRNASGHFIKCPASHKA
jgi:hypothetical protein